MDLATAQIIGPILAQLSQTGVLGVFLSILLVFLYIAWKADREDRKEREKVLLALSVALTELKDAINGKQRTP